VPGLHQWPGAPDLYAVLRAPHRHLFTFELEVDVTDPDREQEFIHVAAQMKAGLESRFESKSIWNALDFGSRSCEMLAEWMLEQFPGASRCTVWEDMENAGGAER
jgi:hypothetical protein